MKVPFTILAISLLMLVILLMPVAFGKTNTDLIMYGIAGWKLGEYIDPLRNWMLDTYNKYTKE